MDYSFRQNHLDTLLFIRMMLSNFLEKSSTKRKADMKYRTVDECNDVCKTVPSRFFILSTLCHYRDNGGQAVAAPNTF